MKTTLRELWAFLKPHWPHLIAAVPMVVGVTLLHESAHALAVVVQGGEVIEFRVLPSATHWGRVRYTFDAGQPFSRFAVSVAPYVMWLGCMLATAALSAMARGRWPMWLGATAMVWGYVVPWGDIFNHWASWLMGDVNDFTRAFGEPGPVGGLLFAVVVGAVVAAGYPVQRGLYGPRALRPVAYALAAVLITLLLCASMLV